MMRCPVCTAETAEFGRLLVLGRHEAVYRRCPQCAFIHVLDPRWLDEAYASPITCSDVGLVDRNLRFARTARVVISCLFDRHGRFIDYGGGAGLFTRLMRDAGYDFFWHDRHCRNLYAGGFSADLGAGYELLTAVEVLEHLTDPLATLREMTGLSRNLLFMTQLLPDPPPAPGEWWYYGAEHGQHVSFFARETLQRIAGMLGLHFATNGHSLHLFSARPVSATAFRVLTCEPVAALLGPVLRRPSLLPCDFRSSRGQGG
jgi:hypothetical protein